MEEDLSGRLCQKCKFWTRDPRQVVFVTEPTGICTLHMAYRPAHGKQAKECTFYEKDME